MLLKQSLLHSKFTEAGLKLKDLENIKTMDDV